MIKDHLRLLFIRMIKRMFFLNREKATQYSFFPKIFPPYFSSHSGGSGTGFIGRSSNDFWWQEVASFEEDSSKISAKTKFLFCLIETMLLLLSMLLLLLLLLLMLIWWWWWWCTLYCSIDDFLVWTSIKRNICRNFWKHHPTKGKTKLKTRHIDRNSETIQSSISFWTL